MGMAFAADVFLDRDGVFIVMIGNNSLLVL